MNFFSKGNPDRWYHFAWLLCIISLPWIDMANNICLILLAIIAVVQGDLKLLWPRLKSSRWAWPFLTYYAVLLFGMIYSPDIDNGLFTLDKKITYLGLPVIAMIGKNLNPEFISFLKRSFVYSCTVMILLCLGLAAKHFVFGETPSNFDFNSNIIFNSLHPDASPLWMHFSYVQLSNLAGLHPAYFSMYLVFCLAILFTETDLPPQQRRIHIFIALLIAGAIALLSTRMAMIAFGVVGFYLFLVKIQIRSFGFSRQIIPVSLVLLCLIWINPVARFRVMEEPMGTQYQASTTMTNWNSVNYRLLEWSGSWSVIKNHLFFGVGTGGSQAAMNNFYTHFNSSTVGLTHNAHNQFLQTWMESGIIGLFVFSFCLFGSVPRKLTDPAYVSFILIFSLMCLTESIGERQKGVVFFTLFQTLFLAFSNRSK